MEKFCVRQGDVLIMAVDDIPKGVKKLAPEKVPGDAQINRVVLAHGEATGHAHAIYEPDRAALFVANDRFMDGGKVRGLDDDDEAFLDRFLKVTGKEPVKLLHDEHSPIELPPGNYRVVRQREYTPEKIVPVMD